MAYHIRKGAGLGVLVPEVPYGRRWPARIGELIPPTRVEGRCTGHPTGEPPTPVWVLKEETLAPSSVADHLPLVRHDEWFLIVLVNINQMK